MHRFASLPTIRSRAETAQPPAFSPHSGPASVRTLLRPASPPSGAVVQRMCSTCEEEDVQRKALPGAGGGALDGALRQGISSSSGSGRPLPGPLRRSFEDRFSADFSSVRAVTGDPAARLNDSLDARAFTVGNHIWFGRGEYRPDSPSGQRLLAHELTHTLQQGSGPQSPQTALRLGSVSDPAEAEADQVADAVMAGKPISPGNA